MAYFDFIPEIWSAQIQESLKKEMPEEQICNTAFQGELANMGDTVHVYAPGAVSVVNYTKNAGYSSALEIPTDTEDTMTVSTAKGFRFYVDTLNKVQGALDPEGPYLKEAVYAIKDAISQAIAAQYLNVYASNVQYPSAALTASNVWDQCNALHYKLNLTKVPREGRFLVVSPRVEQIMNEYLEGRSTPLGDNSAINQYRGRFCGFDIYYSHNVVATTGAGTGSGTGSKVVHKCLAGVRDGISLVYQIPPTSIKTYEPEGYNGVAVKGLVLYGIKMWRSGHLNGILNAWWDS